MKEALEKTIIIYNATGDDELDAMAFIMLAIKNVPNDAKLRVIEYCRSKVIEHYLGKGFVDE